LFEFDQGAGSRLTDSGDVAAGGGAQRDRDRHSLIVVE
jgi:hypothetical protein